MAMDDGATFLPGRGTVFVAPVGTALLNYKTANPDQVATFTGWDCIGNTSRENTVALSKDGGDTTTIGSWWTEALRTKTEPVNWGLTFNSLQVDRLTMGLAFGGGTVADGAFIVPDSVASVEKALFVLMLDGTGRMGVSAAKASLTLGDAPEIATDGLFEIQIAATILGRQGERMRWHHKSFDTP